MESYLRIILLLIAVLIVVLIVFESRARKRRLKRMNQTPIVIEHDEPKITTQVFTEPQPHTIEFNAEPVNTFEPTESENQTKENIKIDTKENPYDDLLIISVMARPGAVFSSYDLLHAISAAGMQFGEMKIFHYYLPTEGGRLTLFSLASATKPGHFDLDKIGDFSCAGLTLFTNLREVPDPEEAFELMYSTAEQLAEDLDGELRGEQFIPWSDITLQKLQERVLQFKMMKEYDSP